MTLTTWAIITLILGCIRAIVRISFLCTDCEAITIGRVEVGVMLIFGIFWMVLGLMCL